MHRTIGPLSLTARPDAFASTGYTRIWVLRRQTILARHRTPSGGEVRKTRLRPTFRNGRPAPSSLRTRAKKKRNEIPSRWVVWKSRIDLVQSLAMVVVLVLGGWWFLRQEQSTEKLNPVVQVESRHVAPSAALLMVQVTLTNVGQVPVELHFLHVTFPGRSAGPAHGKEHPSSRRISDKGLESDGPSC